eukprot:scaffold36493_cov62-Phaeocystis_antarctica.AAC.3
MLSRLESSDGLRLSYLCFPPRAGFRLAVPLRYTLKTAMKQFTLYRRQRSLDFIRFVLKERNNPHLDALAVGRVERRGRVLEA